MRATIKKCLALEFFSDCGIEKRTVAFGTFPGMRRALPPSARLSARISMLGSLFSSASAGKTVIRLAGDQPSPLNPPAGCHFHPRCPHAFELCRQIYPEKTFVDDTHWARCHWVAAQIKGD